MKVKQLTCTSMFLVPALQIGTERLEQNGFINAFLDDINHSMHYEDSVYILFKPHDFDKFYYFLNKERDRITIVEDYDYEEYVVIVYQLPKDILDDYQLFLEGKYSHFSEKMREKFTKYVRDTKDFTFQWKIINKMDDIKQYWEDKLGVVVEGELWEKPDFSKEVLDIEEIKSKTNV